MPTCCEDITDPVVGMRMLFWTSFSVGTLYPLTTFVVRIQSASGFQRTGGFTGPYQGLSAAAFLVFAGASLQESLVQDKIHDLLPQDNRQRDREALQTIVPPFLSNLCTHPFLVAMTKMQTGEARGLDKTFNLLWKERGGIPLSSVTGGFYRGFMLSVPFSIAETKFVDPIIEAAIKNSCESPLEKCIYHGLYGVATMCALNPVYVLSTRLMIGHDHENVPYKGIVDVFRRSVTREGLSVLWRGTKLTAFLLGITRFIHGDYDAFDKVFHG